ncbi:MAG: DUF4352 domain-containing protein [Rubrobacter sp.]|nr:DUF4352 domain-containing protein [Rubrobacter sp.]
MARYCENCGNALSEGAQFCPSCGRPAHETARVSTPEADVGVPPPPQSQTPTGAPQGEQNRRHPVLMGCLGIIVVVVLLGILVAVVGGDEETAGNGSEGGGEAAPADEAEEEVAEEEQVASIGEEVSVGDVSYTVTNAENVSQLEDPYDVDEPLTGNFILVSFTFANNGNEPVTVSDIGLYLYDSEMRQYETDSDAVFYLPEDTSLFMLDRVNPGLSQEIQTVYAVPPEAEGFELEVTSGFFESESQRIELGL